MYEIFEILVCEQSYSFVCKQFEIRGFDSFFNSIQISLKETDDNFVLIQFSDLENKQSYGKIEAIDKMFIIADTLNVYRPE